MLPIIVLSLIFLGMGFMVTENNALYLLAGFNTMTEEERKQVQLKPLVTYFRQFHVFLSVSLFVIGTFLFYITVAEWAWFFMGSYSLVAYLFLLWRTQKFIDEKSKKQKVGVFISTAILFAVLIWMTCLFVKDMNDKKLKINQHKIEGKAPVNKEL